MTLSNGKVRLPTGNEKKNKKRDRKKSFNKLERTSYEELMGITNGVINEKHFINNIQSESFYIWASEQWKYILLSGAKNPHHS